ncbi:hypothetical protein WJ08_10100 [Burkholderia vietnamiensis]|nr:hypothetical protein WJ08_10100 [Burkholderia vietnamiensis]KVF41986.1 hypothetical protein WJ10_13420 [Burkholderia vietnamiensis]
MHDGINSIGNDDSIIDGRARMLRQCVAPKCNGKYLPGLTRTAMHASPEWTSNPLRRHAD